MTMEIRDFRETDWLGFCGAEKFDGEDNQPLIASGKFVSGSEWTYVISKNGAEIMMEDDNDQSISFGIDTEFCSKEEAIAHVRALGDIFGLEQFVKCGYNRII